MFELLAMLCLAAEPAQCREVLWTGPAPACDVPAEAPRLEDKTLIFKAFRCAPAQAGLSVAEVVPGVYVHAGQVAEPGAENRGDVANLGFVVGRDHVAVIDTGASASVGEDLIRAIREVTDLPIAYVILTHMHPDHVLGTRAFARSKAKVVGHSGLPRALADRVANYTESLSALIGPAQFIGSGVAPVDVTVEGRLTLDLGGRLLHVQAWPTAHTGTDITVLDAQTGTLFAGDLVFHRHTPALDGSVRGWRAVLADMAVIDVQRVVPGHGDASLPWPEGAQPLNRYLDALETQTRAAVAAGKRLGEAVDDVGQDEADNWDLFEAYHKRNVTVAFTELEWE